MLPTLSVYLAAINFIAFALFAIDKSRARRHAWRIPERTLFLSALLGGSVGALLAMYLLHHKTRHQNFTLGIPLILLFHIALLYYLIR